MYNEIKYSAPYRDIDLHLPKKIKYDIKKSLIISDNFSIIIGVLSSPHNFKKRYSFRYNYYRFSNLKNSKLVFFFGESQYENKDLISRELYLYNDIVQFSFQNSYLNLTRLSVMSLQFCYTYFNSIKFYIKTDDDMFINYDVLESTLNNVNYNECKVYGHLSSPFKPNRNKNYKSYIPYFQYPFKIIPKYVYGGLIIITKNALNNIYNQTLLEQYYVWKEDVNLGILCNLSGNIINKYPNTVDIKTRGKKCVHYKNVIATEIDSFIDKFYCI